MCDFNIQLSYFSFHILWKDICRISSYEYSKNVDRQLMKFSLHKKRTNSETEYSICSYKTDHSVCSSVFFLLNHNAYSRLLVEWHYVAVSGLVFYDFNFEIFSTQGNFMTSRVVDFPFLFSCCCLYKCIFHNIKYSEWYHRRILHSSSSGFVAWFKSAFLYSIYSGMVILQNASIAPWNQEEAQKKQPTTTKIYR